MNSLFKRIILSILVAGAGFNVAYMVVDTMRNNMVGVALDMLVMFFSVLAALTIIDSEE